MFLMGISPVIRKEAYLLLRVSQTELLIISLISRKWGYFEKLIGRHNITVLEVSDHIVNVKFGLKGAIEGIDIDPEGDRVALIDFNGILSVSNVNNNESLLESHLKGKGMTM